MDAPLWGAVGIGIGTAIGYRLPAGEPRRATVILSDSEGSRYTSKV